MRRIKIAILNPDWGYSASLACAKVLPISAWCFSILFFVLMRIEQSFEVCDQLLYSWGRSGVVTTRTVKDAIIRTYRKCFLCIELFEINN